MLVFWAPFFCGYSRQNMIGLHAYMLGHPFSRQKRTIR